MDSLEMNAPENNNGYAGKYTRITINPWRLQIDTPA